MRTLVVNALRMVGKPTAIGRHIEHLAQQWSKTEIPFDKVILMSPGKLHLAELGSTTSIELRSFGAHWPRLFWEQWCLPRAARDAAILYSLYTCPLYYRGRVVVANHGILDSAPNTLSWSQRMRATPINRRSAHRANRVIAISRLTKSDLVKHFGLSASKIDIIYPAPSDLFFEPHDEESITEEVEKALGKKVPYVLFVGKLSKRRHLPDLIEAFSIVREKQNIPHHLILVGPNVNNLSLQALAEKHGVGSIVKFYPYLEQPRLAKLYAGAELFVQPSTYEGFGRTISEAMASGTAVLAVGHRSSDKSKATLFTPACLEIYGADAVRLVPTPSVMDLVQGMQTLLTDRDLRRKLEERGPTRVKKSLMLKCAKETMRVLDRIALPSDRRN